MVNYGLLFKKVFGDVVEFEKGVYAVKIAESIARQIIYDLN